MADINTRKRGSKWEYYFETAKIDGKRQRISKGGFPTKKEALAEGNKLLSEYNHTGLNFLPSEISFSDYLDLWMKEYVQVNCKESTIDGYRKKINNHIKPNLGAYKLKSITPATIQVFINQKFNEGYSRNTLSVIKGILTSCLSYAVEPLKFISYNQALGIKIPSSRSKANTATRTEPHVYITPSKMQEIFERFPEGTSSHIAMQLGYRCGLRIGEAYALTWDDLDFSQKKININKQIQYNNETKVWYLTPPKYESYRIINIDDMFYDILCRAKEKQEKAKIFYESDYIYNYIDDENIINKDKRGKQINFVNVRDNGELITPRNMLHTSYIIHSKLNFPEFDFHSLRHTHATMLAEIGAPPKYVQERLGHKNIQITMQIYQHVTDAIRNEGTTYLNKIFKQ